MRVITYLSHLSRNSFWKEEVLKTCQQNAAIYASWMEGKKVLPHENTNNLSNKELNCVLEWPRMATYDFCLGTFIGMYLLSS